MVTLTWFVSKYKIHKLHQRYSLKKGCPPVAYIPSISGTLSDTGMYKRKRDPVFVQNRIHSPLISKLAHTQKQTNTHTN